MGLRTAIIGQIAISGGDVPAARVAGGASIERAPQLAARLPDHELWIGLLRDPDRNLVGLMKEKR